MLHVWPMKRHEKMSQIWAHIYRFFFNFTDIIDAVGKKYGEGSREWRGSPKYFFFWEIWTTVQRNVCICIFLWENTLITVMEKHVMSCLNNKNVSDFVFHLEAFHYTIIQLSDRYNWLYIYYINFLHSCLMQKQICCIWMLAVACWQHKNYVNYNVAASTQTVSLNVRGLFVHIGDLGLVQSLKHNSLSTVCFGHLEAASMIRLCQSLFYHLGFF